MSPNRFLDIFLHHVQRVNKPAHTSGSLIDVYIKRTNVTVEKIYFSDHDAVRIAIEANSADSHINP